MENYYLWMQQFMRERQIGREQEKIIVESMKKIVRRESTDELTYDYLKVISKSKIAYQLLDRMIREKRKQYKILKDIYLQLFGRSIEVNAPTFQKPKSFPEGIRSLILKKSELIYEYVKLMQNLPAPYAPLIYPMIVEEQTHIALLNYLLTD